MSAGAIVLSALKAVGSWVLGNPSTTLEVVDKVVKSKEDKERLTEVEEKVNQLGAAALEIDQKIDTELVALRKQMRIMKIMMIAMLIALAVVAVVVIILAILKK